MRPGSLPRPGADDRAHAWKWPLLRRCPQELSHDVAGSGEMCHVLIHDHGGSHPRLEGREHYQRPAGCDRAKRIAQTEGATQRQRQQHAAIRRIESEGPPHIRRMARSGGLRMQNKLGNMRRARSGKDDCIKLCRN